MVENGGYIDMDYQQIPYQIKTLQVFKPEVGYRNYVYIMKSDDGWYWIEYFKYKMTPPTNLASDWGDYLVKQRRYKCDQFDGLVAGFKDLEFI